jgi:hypothetical protein
MPAPPGAKSGQDQTADFVGFAKQRDRHGIRLVSTILGRLARYTGRNEILQKVLALEFNVVFKFPGLLESHKQQQHTLNDSTAGSTTRPGAMIWSLEPNV